MLTKAHSQALVKPTLWRDLTVSGSTGEWYLGPWSRYSPPPPSALRPFTLTKMLERHHYSTKHTDNTRSSAPIIAAPGWALCYVLLYRSHIAVLTICGQFVDYFCNTHFSQPYPCACCTQQFVCLRVPKEVKVDLVWNILQPEKNIFAIISRCTI